ncbi:MAG: DUF3943 domain-containing protein [Treponema sp.]|nr:DUF3943 domain-containing protein [Treponema sp.]
MKRFLSSILILVLTMQLAVSQSDETSEQEKADGEITFSVMPKPQESGGFLHENDGKKHYLTAVGLVAFYNVFLCSWNRYVGGRDWAKVGPNEWNRFWEREMSWDKDWYWTNFVLHPYQGSFYYMGARASNLNKLESFALTVLGSASWEYLCETNAPSKNDMVYTTVGAFPVGEMLYRLSLEGDEISSLLGFALNPTRLWTQLFTRQKPLGTSGHIHELSLKLPMGTAFAHVNLIDYDGDYDETEMYPIFVSPELYVVYNDPYRHDSNDPYSQFSLSFKAGAGKGSGNGADCAFAELDKNLYYNIRILSDGMMFARELDRGENKDTSIGMVMEYDFDWHSYYLLTSLAPGFAFKQRITNEDDSTFEYQTHLAAILLGTSDFYYYRRYFDEKYSEDAKGLSAPYNYTIGFETKLLAKYKKKDGSNIGVNFRGYAMYDFYDQLQYLENGERGTQLGWEFIGITSFSAELALNKKVRIGLEDELYTKYGIYHNIDDVFQVMNSTSVYAKIQAK